MLLHSLDHCCCCWSCCERIGVILVFSRRYDVAVVRLNRRVDMAPHISPICLPPKDMNMHDVHGWAAGWGALQPGSRLRPKTLQVKHKHTLN